MTAVSEKPIPERWRTEYELAEEINLSLGSTLTRKVIEELGAAEAQVSQLQARNRKLVKALRVTIEICENGDTGCDFRRVGRAMQVADAALKTNAETP